MPRPSVILLALAVLAACETPADRDPELFLPSAGAATAPLPKLLPLAELAAPPGSGAESLALLHLDAQNLAIRAEALRARARLASGEVMTAGERARLMAAAARWTGA